MNSLNRYHIILTFALCIAFLFTACKKYEDGPRVSLRLVKTRLAGSYTIEKAYVNGVDKINEVCSLKITDFTLYTRVPESFNTGMGFNILWDNGRRNWSFDLNKDKTKIKFLWYCSSNSTPDCPPSFIPTFVSPRWA